MAAIHDALATAIDALIEHDATLRTTEDDLRRWLIDTTGVTPPVGAIDVALRQMHEAGQIELYTEGIGGLLRITPCVGVPSRRSPGASHIVVNANNAQIGNGNRQTFVYGKTKRQGKKSRG